MTADPVEVRFATTQQSLREPSGDSPARVLRYDVRQLQTQLADINDEFAIWSRTDRVREVVGEQTLTAMRARDKQIMNRLHGNASIMVLGDFKRGKSTLVNALLRTTVATTNITPETLTINEISFGAEPAARAILNDGGSVALSKEDLHAEQLGPLLQRLPAAVDHVEISAPVEWLEGVRLVDTPGTGDLTSQFEQTVTAYLPEADAIIYVMSALAPLSESEQAFLQAMVVPQEFPKLLFVVNMLDIAQSPGDAARVLDATREKLTKIFPNAALFGLSALAEVRRLESRTEPNQELSVVLRENFETFREHLREMVVLNRDVMRLDRTCAQIQQMAHDFAKQADLVRGMLRDKHTDFEASLSAYEASDSQIAERRAAGEAEMRHTMARLSDQTVGWLGGFVDRLQEDVIDQLSTFSPNDIQQHFQFFLGDALRQAVDQCVARQRPEILRSLAVARASYTEGFRTVVEIGSNDANSSADAAATVFGDLAWSILDTGSMLLSRGRLQVLRVVADLFIRRASQPSIAAAQRKRLTSLMPDLKEMLAAQVRGLYVSFADKMAEELGASYDEETASALAALRQAMHLRDASERHLEEAAAVWEDIHAQVTTTCGAVERVRQKLWIDATVS